MASDATPFDTWRFVSIYSKKPLPFHLRPCKYWDDLVKEIYVLTLLSCIVYCSKPKKNSPYWSEKRSVVFFSHTFLIAKCVNKTAPKKIEINLEERKSPRNISQPDSSRNSSLFMSNVWMATTTPTTPPIVAANQATHEDDDEKTNGVCNLFGKEHREASI